MTYATQQDLIDRVGEQELIQLTDVDRVGAINADVVAGALEDADAEINVYLAARYSLPLSTTPTILKRLAISIARYRLHDDAATEKTQKDYNDTIALLKAISNGTASLGVDTGGDAVVPANSAQMEGGTRVFARDDDGFI